MSKLKQGDEKRFCYQQRGLNKAVPLVTVIPSMFDSLSKTKKMLLEIRLNWAQFVGASIATKTFARKISFSDGKNQQGTLYIDVDSLYALEVQHTTLNIIDAVNKFFGFSLVGAVRFVQGRNV